jgi:hypothetical protein
MSGDMRRRIEMASNDTLNTATIFDTKDTNA